MGWDGYQGCVATDIQFRSNVVEGGGFEIDATGQDHSYKVYWSLEIHVNDKMGNPAVGKEVRILDKNGEEVFRQVTGQEGNIHHDLPEYSFGSGAKTFSSPYTIMVGKKKQEFSRTSDSFIKIVAG